MTPATWRVLLPWLCEELVRELLRGAWGHVLRRTGAAQDRAFDRFAGLVNAADCWPCRVEFAHPAHNGPDERGGFRAALCIMSGEAADFAEEEDWQS